MVTLSERTGVIHSDLTIGPNVASAQPLIANHGLSCRGVVLHGSGFLVPPEKAEDLGLGRIGGLEAHIRPYRNGRDITTHSRNVMVIDLLGLEAEDVRHRLPEVYQHLVDFVKPERDHNNRPTRRERWWLFGETVSTFRPALRSVSRYIATVETAKHRFFVFLDASILPDNMLVNIASDDGYVLGVLSSRIHVAWALAAGGRLGVGNDPRYNKSPLLRTLPLRCAMTGERTLPVLEAAHIMPYSVVKRHELSNALLLRSDLHRLFDEGYVTVDPVDRKILVSRRIKEEFDNGREYYQLESRKIIEPCEPWARPSSESLEYHAYSRFR